MQRRDEAIAVPVSLACVAAEGELALLAEGAISNLEEGVQLGRRGVEEDVVVGEVVAGPAAGHLVGDVLDPLARVALGLGLDRSDKEVFSVADLYDEALALFVRTQ